jgi:chromosome segregation ATPase
MLGTLTSILPYLAAIVVGLLTAFSAIYVGRLKNNVDVKALTVTANDALRDDLLHLIDRYEQKEQFLITRIEIYEKRNLELQDKISELIKENRDLLEEVGKLRTENAGLKKDISELRDEIHQARIELKNFDKTGE